MKGDAQPGNTAEDAELPVPCKCCGGLHPECGCWDLANKAQLRGHLCLNRLENSTLSVVWCPQHPSQQRSAIYFHASGFDRAVVELHINTAALPVLRKLNDPATWVSSSIAIAESRRDQAVEAIKVALAFLDKNDPTRKHPCWDQIGELRTWLMQ